MPICIVWGYKGPSGPTGVSKYSVGSRSNTQYLDTPVHRNYSVETQVVWSGTPRYNFEAFFKVSVVY